MAVVRYRNTIDEELTRVHLKAISRQGDYTAYHQTLR